MLPTGIVTFLLTDVEGSTALWEDAPEAMRAALARHDVLFEQAVQAHLGIHIRPRGEGDSRFAVYQREGLYPAEILNGLNAIISNLKPRYSAPQPAPQRA